MSFENGIFTALQKRDGTAAVYYQRTLGSRNSTTGKAAITYTGTATITIFWELLSSILRRTEAGDYTEQTIQIWTTSVMGQYDKIVVGSESYDIVNDPEPFYSHGALCHYRYTGVRRVD